MSLKQISLAAMVAMAFAGSGAAANAEGSLHGSGLGATGAYTSGTMQDDEALKQTPGFERFQGTMPDEGGPRSYGYVSPTVGPSAYGYANEQTVRPTVRHRTARHHESKTTNRMI